MTNRMDLEEYESREHWFKEGVVTSKPITKLKQESNSKLVIASKQK